MKSIVWFRGKDLRLSDHAPLREGLAAGEVISLFVLDPYFFAPSRARELPRRIQFLLDSLRSLEREVAALGSRLVVLAGKSTEVVPRVADAWKADRVLAHRWVEPVGRERDRRIQVALGARFQSFEGEMLGAPGTLRTAAGDPYSVFGAFARAFTRSVEIGNALPAPRSLPPLPRDVVAEAVPIPTCAELGFSADSAILRGGEREAQSRLRRFVREALPDYSRNRSRLDLPGTSRLSADLKFGTLSVRQVWNEVQRAGGDGRRAFLSELLWREFAYSTLWDFPHVLEAPFDAAFADFPWREDDAAFEAWTSGTTGYPTVDAGARQLLREGFVHNRARMICASFLAKHLLVDPRRGEAHYMKFLTDGDWANNDAGWQWTVGSGCDAQPWFRIFNPVLQGEQFDPEGAYVRRWIPELARMPARFIHRPWEAPDEVLRAAGVHLGETYPRPIVEHRVARERFLAVARQHLERAAVNASPRPVARRRSSPRPSSPADFPPSASGRSLSRSRSSDRKR